MKHLVAASRDIGDLESSDSVIGAHREPVRLVGTGADRDDADENRLVRDAGPLLWHQIIGRQINQVRAVLGSTQTGIVAPLHRGRRLDDVTRSVVALELPHRAAGPGVYADRSELFALAKAAAAMGGRYISHIRSEDRAFWEAIDEILAIGRETRIPVQISHVKLAMRKLWGQSDLLIEKLNRARADGLLRPSARA